VDIPTTLHAEPIEVAGKWFVDITIGGLKLTPKGPFKDADAAKAAIGRLAQNWPKSTLPVPAAKPPAVSHETVLLHGQEVELTSPEGHRLVVACTRAGESLISDADVISEFQISDSEWKAIAANAALGRAIKAESQRRINNGVAARESAAKIWAKAPEVLGKHLNDPAANARSVVEIHRELRATVHGPGAENTPDAGQPFIIRIDLSGGSGNSDEVIEIVKDLTPKPPQIEGEIDGEVVAISEQE